MHTVEATSPKIVEKKEARRKFGHDSDSESDTEDLDLFSTNKPLGPMFCHHPIDTQLDEHLPGLDRGEEPSD